MKKLIIFAVISFLSLYGAFGESIVFSASTMTGQAGSKNTTTKLSGNAYIKTDTLEIHGENVELSGDDFRYIKASGNVDGKNLETKMDFSCDNLEYDRETKIAILKGNVKFKDVENEVEAEAQIIEYNQNTEISILQIGITLKQEDNICNGSYGVYYKEKQLLELSGNAQVKQKEDLFRAQHITLNLDTQEITLGGNVKGSVKDTKVVEKEDGEEKPVDEEKTDSETADDEIAGEEESKDEKSDDENKKTQVEKVIKSANKEADDKNSAPKKNVIVDKRKSKEE